MGQHRSVGHFIFSPSSRFTLPQNLYIYYGLSLRRDDVLIVILYFPHCLKPSSLVTLQGRCNSVCNPLPGGLGAKEAVFTESFVSGKGHADSHMPSQQQRSFNVRLLHGWLRHETRCLPASRCKCHWLAWHDMAVSVAAMTQTMRVVYRLR